VHTDLAKFGAHAHLDKDRAVTDAGGGQALDLRCRTFNLLPPDCSRLRVPVCRWFTHIAGPGCGSLPRRNPDPPSSGLQGVTPCRRLPCRSVSCIVSRSPYPPPGKCWPPLAKPPEKGTVRQPSIAQLDGYLRPRNAQTVGRDLTNRRIGARAHVLRAALDQQRPIGFQVHAQLAGLPARGIQRARHTRNRSATLRRPKRHYLLSRRRLPAEYYAEGPAR
jgi:hypothetical protein